MLINVSTQYLESKSRATFFEQTRPARRPGRKTSRVGTMKRKDTELTQLPNFHSESGQCTRSLKEIAHLKKKKQRNNIRDEGVPLLDHAFLSATKDCVRPRVEPSGGSSLHDLSVSGQVFLLILFLQLVLFSDMLCSGRDGEVSTSQVERSSSVCSKNYAMANMGRVVRG
jgi:hypothetical protein